MVGDVEDRTLQVKGREGGRVDCELMLCNKSCMSVVYEIRCVKLP